MVHPMRSRSALSTLAALSAALELLTAVVELVLEALLVVVLRLLLLLIGWTHRESVSLGPVGRSLRRESPRERIVERKGVWSE
jgi:hypothetical protein